MANRAIEFDQFVPTLLSLFLRLLSSFFRFLLLIRIYEGEAIGKVTPRTYSWVYVRQYCDKIDEAAQNRMELIMRSLAKQNGVTEQLKAENQMEWVRQMNACKAQAEEIVKFELIYD